MCTAIPEITVLYGTGDAKSGSSWIGTQVVAKNSKTPLVDAARALRAEGVEGPVEVFVGQRGYASRRWQATYDISRLADPERYPTVSAALWGSPAGEAVGPVVHATIVPVIMTGRSRGEWKHQLFSLRLDETGELIVEMSRQPEYDGCRELLARGVTGTLLTKHEGRPASMVLDIAQSARLSIREDARAGPQTERLSPIKFAEAMAVIKDDLGLPLTDEEREALAARAARFGAKAGS